MSCPAGFDTFFGRALYTLIHRLISQQEVQGIAGALLWYTCAVDNKLLVILSAIGSQQSANTEATTAAVD